MSDLVPTNKDANVPAFMQEDQDLGLETVQKFVRPPYIKIVHDMSKELKKKGFEPGTAILLPNEEIICSIGDGSFTFVPIYMFADYVKVNPIDLRGVEPYIVERSTDSNSQLAKKCRNPDTWKERHPNSTENKVLYYRNVERLNFIVTPVEGPLTGVPMLMTFSKAEHKTGRNFSALIMARSAALFSTVYRGTMAVHEYQGGKEEGPGWDIEVEGWLAEEGTYAKCKELYHKFHKLHADANIVVDDGDDDFSEDPADSEEY